MSVNLTPQNLKKIGVLCSWYCTQPDTNPNLFSLEQVEETHAFLPASTYVCTLSHGCFSEFIETAVKRDESTVMSLDQAKLDLATAKSLKLTEAALSFINTLVNNISKQKVQSGKTSNESVIIDDSSPSSSAEECWCICGNVQLGKKDLQLVVSGKKLTDNHMDAFQNLVKMVGGLQTTLLQKKSPLKRNGNEMLLQIIHPKDSHWATLQIIGNDIRLFDSAYSSACSSTLSIIAQLVRSKEKAIQVKMMNVAKQTGASDCGLYALAILTCLANDTDPINHSCI